MSLPVGIDFILDAHTIESNRIEFKSGWNPGAIIRTIVAFANDIDNDGGGYILIGVEEKNGVALRPIKGIDEAKIDSLEKELLRFCHLIEPYYAPRLEIAHIDGKAAIVLWVTPGHSRPYRAPKDVTLKNDVIKRYWIRRYSNTVEASSEEIKELYEISSSVPYDDQPCPYASVGDLSLDIIMDYLRITRSSLYERAKSMSLLELADDLSLLDGPSEKRYPKNVAILMFSEHPERYFPEAFIEVVFLPHANGDEIREKRFAGPLQRQLEGALNFLRGNILEERIEKIEGVALARHTWNYPFAALEEILSNAVYHKSYQIREPITVTVAPNYIDIRSYPGFDRSITDEAISEFTIKSKRPYRNRSIGNFLKDYRLTEGRNTGIPKALDALRSNGSFDPVFMMDPERSSLTVRLWVEKGFAVNSLPVRQSQRKNRDEITRNVLSILASSGSASSSEIAKKLGYAKVSKTLSGILAALLCDGYVTRTGSGRNSKWSLISLSST